MHDPHALLQLIRLAGADKVALGSDYPFPLGEWPPGALIDALGLSAAVRDRLRSGTALEWLGRDAAAYDL